MSRQISPESVVELRRQLVAARDGTVRRMVKFGTVDGGLVALLGSLGAALAALDHLQPAHADRDRAERVALSDDGSTIRLVLFHAAGALVAGVDFDPLRAIGLARELIEAAHRRLGR